MFLSLLPSLTRRLLQSALARLQLISSALMTHGSLALPEPSGRARLTAGVRIDAPAWFELRGLSLELDPSAWERACVQHDYFRDFLRRALWGKEAATVKCVLDSCALHQDYCILLDAVDGDPCKVARLRAAFNTMTPPEEDEAGSPWRETLQPTFRNLWRTLLCKDALDRKRQLLLFDVWTAPCGDVGQRVAAAFAVYGLFLFDFLRGSRTKLHGEVLADCYALAANGALAAAAPKRAPEAWRSQLAALRMGVSRRPKLRR